MIGERWKVKLSCTDEGVWCGTVRRRVWWLWTMFKFQHCSDDRNDCIITLFNVLSSQLPRKQADVVQVFMKEPTDATSQS